MKLNDALDSCGIIAILRGVTPAEVIEVSTALYESGIRIVEVPLNSPEPFVSIEKLAKAFLDLNPATAEGKEILDLQRATRFVSTRPENYKGIETAARSAGLLK